MEYLQQRPSISNPGIKVGGICLVVKKDNKTCHVLIDGADQESELLDLTVWQRKVKNSILADLKTICSTNPLFRSLLVPSGLTDCALAFVCFSFFFCMSYFWLCVLH